MGTTVHGLPYPEPTDPVAAGAAAIRALAEAVDTKLAPLRATRQYHVAMSTGPRTDNGPIVDLGAYLAAAVVTGFAYITVTGEAYVGASMNMSVQFNTPLAPPFGYSAKPPQGRINVPQSGNMTAQSWTPFETVTMVTPITAGQKPSFNVNVFIGIAATQWYLAVGMNVLEVAT